MLFDAKQWLRNNFLPYLTIIKGLIAALSGRVDAVESRVTSLESITGTFKGAFDTVAEMPVGSGVKNGDWAILKVDIVGTGTIEAPQYESGIYLKASAGWQFAFNLESFQEISQQILASQSEADAGTSTSKVLTVAQTVAKINAALAQLDLSSKADVGGNAMQKFLVGAADIESDQAVRASQFSGSISAAEAHADWNNA